jgi:hypothetical protein
MIQYGSDRSHRIELAECERSKECQVRPVVGKSFIWRNARRPSKIPESPSEHLGIERHHDGLPTVSILTTTTRAEDPKQSQCLSADRDAWSIGTDEPGAHPSAFVSSRRDSRLQGTRNRTSN